MYNLFFYLYLILYTFDGIGEIFLSRQLNKALGPSSNPDKTNTCFSSTNETFARCESFFLIVPQHVYFSLKRRKMKSDSP